ncbi:hypothetical protein NDN08_008063 [Rhodosorus marinus]|uniref:RRM domain-containing protein n=1 Tax=Rhodosorus marinus TaxID=101924 RepID=A0AAV8V0G6_9RHOD|nr:hypothetical protein NDN08_008063 [Rhodosorus marinus]
MGPHSGNRFRPAYSGQQKFIFPPNIIELFKARKAPPHVAPPRAKKLRPLDGLAKFIDSFESKESQEKAQEEFLKIPWYETPSRARLRQTRERRERMRKLVEKEKKLYDPKAAKDNVTEDPFKTLFVSRLALETTEAKLMREFETFGRIKSVRMPIRSDTKLPCGYAFIEFEKEKDMKEAYKAGDGRRIDGKRISVDIERGRTVPSWLPKRLREPKKPEKKEPPKKIEPAESKDDRDRESNFRERRGRDFNHRDSRDRPGGGRDRGPRDGGRDYRDRNSGRDRTNDRDYRDRDRDRGYGERDGGGRKRYRH